eukprot:6954469-Alexandrium_andersonii.AAC.1
MSCASGHCVHEYAVMELHGISTRWGPSCHSRKWARPGCALRLPLPAPALRARTAALRRQMG